MSKGSSLSLLSLCTQDQCVPSQTCHLWPLFTVLFLWSLLPGTPYTSNHPVSVCDLLSSLNIILGHGFGVTREPAITGPFVSLTLPLPRVVPKRHTNRWLSALACCFPLMDINHHLTHIFISSIHFSNCRALPAEMSRKQRFVLALGQGRVSDIQYPNHTF